MNSQGRKRIWITNVSPVVEGGKYPAKGVVSDPLIISADIFTDGHDEISARVLLRAAEEKKWMEIPMVFKENDHWEYVFDPGSTGRYQFQVMAWVDHFESWKQNFAKKYTAGQDISVELDIGANLVRKAAASFPAKEKKLLLQWADEISACKDDSAIITILDHELNPLMGQYRDRDLVITFPQVFEIEIERKKAGYSTWYELFPRSASAEPGKHGTFKDVISLLPRISEMGFDVLYFPPIHPVGEVKRKGKNNSLIAETGEPGSPWAIGSRFGGHKDINPELGNLKDFKKLVKEAARLDIEIAMDIAFQCAPDHPYVQEHPEWFKWRPDGTVQYAENPPKRYEDILPFNFETEDWVSLWMELKSVFDYWIAQGITIFRIDNPHTKAFAFWEWVIREIRKVHPGVIFLAEAFTRPRLMEMLAKIGFNQSYTYFTWRNNKHQLEEYLTELTKGEMRHYFRPNFWPNTPDILPDELVHGGENSHIIRLLLAATLSSNYGLYGPVYEFVYNAPTPGKEEYYDNEKYEIRHWDWHAETRLREIITRVNRIRKQNAAFQSTYNLEFAHTTDENIICYVKKDEKAKNVVIVAINLDPHNTRSAWVTLPEASGPFPENYTVYDLLSGDRFHWHGTKNFVQLNPYEMPGHILMADLPDTSQTL